VPQQQINSSNAKVELRKNGYIGATTFAYAWLYTHEPNFPGNKILEGGSSLSADPTATLFRISCLRRMKTPILVKLVLVFQSLPNFLNCSVLFCPQASE
jgi:hypothetical protein